MSLHSDDIRKCFSNVIKKCKSAKIEPGYIIPMLSKKEYSSIGESRLKFLLDILEDLPNDFGKIGRHFLNDLIDYVKKDDFKGLDKDVHFMKLLYGDDDYSGFQDLTAGNARRSSNFDHNDGEDVLFLSALIYLKFDIHIELDADGWLNDYFHIQHGDGKYFVEYIEDSEDTNNDSEEDDSDDEQERKIKKRRVFQEFSDIVEEAKPMLNDDVYLRLNNASKKLFDI